MWCVCSPMPHLSLRASRTSPTFVLLMLVLCHWTHLWQMWRNPCSGVKWSRSGRFSVVLGCTETDDQFSVFPPLCSCTQIYSPDHTSSSFPSNPSTPVGSPSPLTATAGAASTGTVVTAASAQSGRPGTAPAFGSLAYILSDDSRL